MAGLAACAVCSSMALILVIVTSSLCSVFRDYPGGKAAMFSLHVMEESSGPLRHPVSWSWGMCFRGRMEGVEGWASPGTMTYT